MGAAAGPDIVVMDTGTFALSALRTTPAISLTLNRGDSWFFRGEALWPGFLLVVRTDTGAPLAYAPPAAVLRAAVWPLLVAVFLLAGALALQAFSVCTTVLRALPFSTWFADRDRAIFPPFFWVCCVAPEV